MLNAQENDSIAVFERFGIRAGIDLSKLIRMAVEEDYKGLEITADYRLKRNLYLAAELGTEEKNIDKNAVDFTSTGSYIKLGIDYNTYKNWKGMENQILVGFRLATSTHKQKVNGYRIRQLNHYWEEELVHQLDPSLTYEGLKATWLELSLGVKAELIRNMYMGISVRAHYLVNDTNINGFENLFIPGFNRVNSDNPWGAGINYTIMYQIPIFKKNRPL